MLNNIIQYTIPASLTLMIIASIIAMALLTWKHLDFKLLGFVIVFIVGMMGLHYSNHYTFNELYQLSQAQLIHDTHQWADCNYAVAKDTNQASFQYQCVGSNIPVNTPGYIYVLKLTRIFTNIKSWKILSIFVILFILFSVIATIAQNTLHHLKATIAITLTLLGNHFLHFNYLQGSVLTGTLLIALVHLNHKSRLDLFALLAFGSFLIYLEPLMVLPILGIILFSHYEKTTKVIAGISLLILTLPLLFWLFKTEYLMNAQFIMPQLNFYLGLISLIAFYSSLKRPALLQALGFSLLIGLFYENIVPFYLLCTYTLILFILDLSKNKKTKDYFKVAYLFLFAISITTAKAVTKPAYTYSMDLPLFPPNVLVYSENPYLFHLHKISVNRVENLLDDPEYIKKIGQNFEQILYHVPMDCDPLTQNIQSDYFDICQEILDIYQFEPSTQGHPFYVVKKAFGSKPIKEQDKTIKKLPKE